MNITSNAEDLAQSLIVHERDILRETKKVVGRTGNLIAARIRKNASTGYHSRRRANYRGHIPGTGPGPNVSTGNYRRSIQVTTALDGSEATSTIHTNAPQARRLEYGFRGVDSAGRSYNQQPFPHWAPALALGEDMFAEELRRTISRIVEGGNK